MTIVINQSGVVVREDPSPLCSGMCIKKNGPSDIDPVTSDPSRLLPFKPSRDVMGGER